MIACRKNKLFAFYKKIYVIYEQRSGVVSSIEYMLTEESERKQDGLRDLYRPRRGKAAVLKSLEVCDGGEKPAPPNLPLQLRSSKTHMLGECQSGLRTSAQPRKYDNF